MNRRFQSNSGYLPSPSPVMAMPPMMSMPMLKLNVTIYFTPELPFTPPSLTTQPQRVLDVLKIMVVMAPEKSVSHLKQQIAKTISIISKDEDLPFDQTMNLSSIRNSHNYIAHNEMTLGHVFNYDENIYAIIISDIRRRSHVIATPQPERFTSHRNDSCRKSRREDYHTSDSHHMMDHSEKRNYSTDPQMRIVKESLANSEDDDAVSEDTYESSFVDKEEKVGFLDLEAQESQGSVSSDNPLRAKKHNLKGSRKRKLKKCRRNMIQISESESEEEEDHPMSYKSYSHFVSDLVEEKIHAQNQNETIPNDETIPDDKEVDEHKVIQDIGNSLPEEEKMIDSKENNQTKAEDTVSQKEEITNAQDSSVSSSESSSDNESEASDQEKKTNQTNQIVQDSVDSSEDSESQSEKSEIQEKPEISQKQISKIQEKSDKRTDLNTISSPQKENKKPAKQSSSKRKYSSLSEIASNASKTSASKKSYSESDDISSSSSSSSDSSSTASDVKTASSKKIRRSSLRSLSRDVTLTDPPKPKNIKLQKPTIKVERMVEKRKVSKSKPGRRIETLLNGSKDFNPVKSNGSESD